MENKTEENESRLITGDFKCTTAKMDRDCVKKHKDFIDVALFLPCQNSLWKMLPWIYREETT